MWGGTDSASAPAKILERYPRYLRSFTAKIKIDVAKQLHCFIIATQKTRMAKNMNESGRQCKFSILSNRSVNG
jgi:hypothetical protein